MTARDVDLLQHRLDALTRAATRIRAHAADLHCLAFEPHHGAGDREQVRGGQPDWAPKSGDERARHVWDRLVVEVGHIEASLVGFERLVFGYFMVNSQSVEPTRGSLIPAGEHARLLAAQRARKTAGEYVPARLVDQPPHPGKRT